MVELEHTIMTGTLNRFSGSQSGGEPSVTSEASTCGESGAHRERRERNPGSYRRVSSRTPKRPSQSDGRLASARDRKRLRERKARERERVERALASAPAFMSSCDAIEEAETQATRPFPVLHALAPLNCPVCGGTRIFSDEVFQLGALRLAECLRCDHRWTDRGPDRWAGVGATMQRTSRRPQIRIVAAGSGAS